MAVSQAAVQARSLRARLLGTHNDILRDELQTFGAKVTGTKPDLVERLAYLIEREEDNLSQDPSKGTRYLPIFCCVLKSTL